MYKKVEKIQSLIFKKVENVEKRIADAEIVDNWMAEAPPLSVKRFEGFRNQVLISMQLPYLYCHSCRNMYLHYFLLAKVKIIF